MTIPGGPGLHDSPTRCAAFRWHNSARRGHERPTEQEEKDGWHNFAHGLDRGHPDRRPPSMNQGWQVHDMIHSIKDPVWLRKVLWADTAVGGSTGALGLIFSGALASLLGLPQSLLQGISIISLGYALGAFTLCPGAAGAGLS